MTYKELSKIIDCPTLQKERVEWIVERMKSASKMPASPLVQAYTESLQVQNNPLSEIFLSEILQRLWGYENHIRLISTFDLLCSAEMAGCSDCLIC